MNPYAEHDARWDDHFSDAVSERYAGEIIDGWREAMAEEGWEGTLAEYKLELARRTEVFEAAEAARKPLEVKLMSRVSEDEEIPF